MANKQVSSEVLQELTNKIQEIVNNYCWNLEHFTDSEVDDFFQASADEVTFYNGLINDTITSKNFLWSSKKIAEELAKAIIEANGYTDNMIKNIASIKLKYVTSLPTSDISENTIYILKASDGTSKDTLNLYNATDGWTSIGDFNISLDDYYTKTETDTKLDLKANKTEVVANDKIVQTLDATTNSSDTVLSTSGLQTEMDKKANDNEVIKKTSLVTSIDKTSTDNEIPSAGAIYNKSKNKIKQLSSGEDIIAYADTISNETATDTVRVMNATNSPYGVNDVNNDFYYTIYNIYDYKFKRIVAYGIRKNDMYMIIKENGVWGTWRRVCTTSVTDVSTTNITSRLVNATASSGSGVSYSVKNGMCYVQFAGVITTTTSSGAYLLSPGSLPPIDNSLSNGHYPVADAGSINGLVVVEGNTGGVRYYGGVMNIFTTISYPVKES